MAFYLREGIIKIYYRKMPRNNHEGCLGGLKAKREAKKHQKETNRVHGERRGSRSSSSRSSSSEKRSSGKLKAVIKLRLSLSMPGKSDSLVTLNVQLKSNF